MRRRSSVGGHLAAGLVGAIVGAVLVLGVDGLSRTPGSRPASSPVEPPLVSPSPEETAAPRPSRRIGASARPRGILLAWAPGGLPAGIEGIVEGVPKIRSATLVRAGLDWIRRTRAPDGSVVDSPSGKRTIPFEVGVIAPREYAPFIPPSERDAIESLKPNEVLLAETSAGMRNGSPGMEIKLLDRTVRVAGVISDIAANGYEAIMRAPAPSSWERVDEFLLVRNGGARRTRIEQLIRDRLIPGQRLRVRVNDEQPFLRYGDAVHPQMIIKEAFGEFAATPLESGQIAIDPSWTKDNIRSARVPILGVVTCHRSLFPQLRRALRSVRSEGLAHLINPNDFGGCFGPRFVSSNPDGRLSHHAWGVAVDLNVAENPFGSEPNLSRRVVDVIESHGFTWGGRWLIPDGMHFEWQSWGTG